MSPPLSGRSGVARTRALEELGTGATEELGTGAPEELGTRATEEPGSEAIEEPRAGASEELVPDDRLLQKDQEQSQNKKKVSITGK